MAFFFGTIELDGPPVGEVIGIKPPKDGGFAADVFICPPVFT